MPEADFTDFQKEADEFFDSLNTALVDGKITLDEYPEIIRQGVEALAVPIAASRGNDKALESIQAYLLVKANNAIDRVDDSWFFKKQAAKGIVAWGVPTLISSIINSDVLPTKWIDEALVPALRRHEKNIHTLVVAWGG